MKVDKSKKIVGLFLGAVLVAVIAYWVADKLLLTSGFPKGVDANAHMTRIAWILRFFPQINWNPFWDSGTPFWIWTYPPLTALLSSVLIKIFSLGVEQGMVLSGAVLMLIGVLGLYAAAWVISKSVLVSIFVSVLTVTTPAFWSWWGHGGNYARIWGLAFYFWSFAFLVWYLKKPSKIRFFLLVLFTSFSFGSHLLYGGLTFLTFGAYLLFAIPGWKKKIIEGIKILGTAFLLSSYWYFPLLLTSEPSGRYVEGAFGAPVIFKDLFILDPEKIFFTLPTRFTVIVLLAVILATILLIKKRYQERLARAVVSGIGLGVLGSLIYILMGNIPGYPEKGYLAVFPPFATLPIFIFFSAYFLAGVLSGLSRRVSTILSLFLTILVIILFVFSLPFEKEAIYDVSQPENAQIIAQGMISKIPLTPDFRFGTDSAFVADWFNYFYPDHPQTRDYIYQGVPHKTWHFYLEYVFWTQEGRYPEAEWLLDWYGVRYFTAGFASATTKHDKFLSRDDLFEVKQADEENLFYVFEYKKAKPVLTTSEAIPILVFGTQDDYKILVRNFAFVDWGTDMAIPVYGGEKLSGFDSKDLAFFPTIFLYRLQPKNHELTEGILNQYLDQGGRVLVEALPQKETQQWSTWAPVAESETIQLTNGWNFSSVKGELEGLSEKDFGPPVFGQDPWKVSWGEPQVGAEVWLKTANHPVVLYKKVGKGEVIWSGINLPYHAESYRKEAEVYWLGRLFKIPSSKRKIAPIEIKKNQPEKRKWIIPEKATGLVWKESWFPRRWRIVWTDSQGQRQKVFSYLAGPSLSYIPLPQEAVYPLIIEASYRLSFLEILGWVVSLATFLFLFVYSFEGKVFPPFITRTKTRFSNKLGSWWEKEEEI